MNLGELKAELKLIVQDSSLEEHFGRWINDALQSLALEFDLPGLRRLDPVDFPVGSTAWYLPAPDTFQKNLFRCYNAAGSRVKILDRIEELERLDWDHDQVGDHISHIVVMEQGDTKYFACFPKADETLKTWFYERPDELKEDEDSPTFLPREYHSSLILPDVVIKNFELLQDLIIDPPHNSLGYWAAKKRLGLYGGPSGEIGFFNWLNKSRGGPRRRGGPDPLP